MTVQKPASVIKRQVKDAIQLLETVCVMTNMVERIVLAIHQWFLPVKAHIPLVNMTDVNAIKGYLMYPLLAQVNFV